MDFFLTYTIQIHLLTENREASGQGSRRKRSPLKATRREGYQKAAPTPCHSLTRPLQQMGTFFCGKDSMFKTSSTRQQQEDLNQPPSLVLHDEVCGKGRGVFAGQPFKKGALVLEFLGEVRDVSELNDLTHALQIGPRDFLTASGGIDDYVNHSCRPNCGIRVDNGRVILFALRDIRVGEEILFDYSTTQSGGYWEMDCQCGVPTCRGRIGDFKDLPTEHQQFYISQRAVLTFLLTND